MAVGSAAVFTSIKNQPCNKMISISKEDYPMRKIGKRACAGLLAVVLTAAVASSQVMAMSLESGASVGVVYNAESMSDIALSNRIGLDNDANNRQTLIPGSEVSANLFSGNLCASLTLFQNFDIPPRDLALTYNSLDDCDYGLGRGIRTSYSCQIIDNGDNTYTYIDSTGSPYIFRDMGKGIYRDYKGRELKVTNDGYHLTDQGSYNFDTDGKMTQILTGGHATSRTTTITYREDGLISSVYNSSSIHSPVHYPPLEYRFEYMVPEGYDHPMVSSIWIIYEDMQQIYSFAYDDHGLSQITKQGEEVLSCAMDDNGMLSQIGDMDITYQADGSGRVASAGDNQYLYGNNQTIVINAAGSMNLYQFDENGMIE